MLSLLCFERERTMKNIEIKNIMMIKTDCLL